jgi:hypothetical protein
MTVTTSEARPAEPRRGPGSILGLVAFALVFAGAATIWADRTHRDDDGYFTTSFERYVLAKLGIREGQ